MILPHTFDDVRHVYHADGRYVLSTSDVIDLNGLTPNYDAIKKSTLDNASNRGKCCHKAIELYEQNDPTWDEHLETDWLPYMDGWFAFRDEHSIQIVGPHEKAYVYEHEGTDAVIGGTVDLRFIYGGYLYIADIKTSCPVSKAALETKRLAWRLQTESYKTATEMDEQFMRAVIDQIHGIRRMVIHIHPDLKPTYQNPQRCHGYELHEFTMDDSLLWDAAVRVAQAKKAAGILPSRRHVDVAGDLRASLEVMA